MGGIKAYIYSKDGVPLKVNGEGEITATLHTHPPADEDVESFPFRAYFKNSSDSNDMRVNGATTAQDFYIEANDDYDIFINSLSIKLADASATLDKFGNLTALTNGVSILWTTREFGEFSIHDGIKDNIEFFRLTKIQPNIIDLTGGGADAIVVQIDLSELFKVPWGLHLKKGTVSKLIFRIQDNLSVGLDEFNVIGHGIQF